MQKRWAEATELAQAAVDADRSDQGAWRLLGTSLFLQDDRRGALQAWNEAGEPRLDTLQIDGLRRTRASTAQRAAGIEPGDRVTPGSVLHVERRLDAVPSISRAQVEYVPKAGGLADVRARVTDRTLFPKSWVVDRGGGRPGGLQSNPQAPDQLAHRRRGALRRFVALPGAPAACGARIRRAGSVGRRAGGRRRLGTPAIRVAGIPHRGADHGLRVVERLGVALHADL